jgi:murein DD-endopeptidase MepM/ murein hydrolase activator NlpD
MNLKLQDLGKAIFIKNSRGQFKIVEVKARLFNRLKAFSSIALIITLILAAGIINLSSKTQKQVEENNKLQTRITALQTQIDSEVSNENTLTAEKANSNSKAVTYIESIQSKLKKINDYLSKRGLSSISFKKINTGDNGKPKLSDEQLYSKYDNYLTSLVSNVSLMPMGYPHMSSLTSFFGYRSNPFDFGEHEFHPGIDFKGRTGDLVKCTASGKVTFTGREGGYGNCIHIQHTHSLETWYGHLSHIEVHEGQHVSVGDVIGRVGSTGRATGPHLHYEIRKNGRPVNPVQYLSLNN